MKIDKTYMEVLRLAAEMLPGTQVSIDNNIVEDGDGVKYYDINVMDSHNQIAKHHVLCIQSHNGQVSPLHMAI